MSGQRLGVEDTRDALGRGGLVRAAVRERGEELGPVNSLGYEPSEAC